MANIQTQAYIICYFHVNAVIRVTMATDVIGRMGQVGGKKVLGFLNIPNAVNPLAKR